MRGNRRIVEPDQRDIPGTSSPASCAAWTMPAAISSLLEKIALGLASAANSTRPASSPVSKV
jgi:hypothetical protein